MNLRKFRASFMMMALALLTALVLGGCGSDGYDTPTQTSTPTSLIEAQTLKTWMDQGLVNNQDGFENVVILEVGTVDPDSTSYEDEHIPGAYLWDQSEELNATRLEALAEAGTSVAPGAMIDPVLQRSGVNRFSTIVITYPGRIFEPARAYFTLRYWGFPKERIKILNGGNKAWASAVTENGWDALALTAERPLEHATNTFSVRENVHLNDDLRYSLGEMILAVDANNESIEKAQKRLINIVQQTSSTPTISNAIGRPWAKFQDPDSAGHFLSDPKAIEDALLASGETAPGTFEKGLPTIVHCASGLSTAPAFFALDGILGMDVALYDGSTNQWTAYMDRVTAPTIPDDYDGTQADWEADWAVVANDAWRTDSLSNNPSEYTGTTLIDPDLNWDYQYVDDPRANQVETEDAEYMKPASNGPPTSVEGDSGNC